MKLRHYLLASALAVAPSAPHAAAQEGDEQIVLTEKQVTELITVLETKRSPNVYSAVYYPDWKDAKDGLKSVTVEAIAEHASERMKEDEIKLEVALAPIVEGSAGAVLLKRSGGGLEPGVFVTFLYHDARNGWGFLSLPIPPKGGRGLDPDTRFTKAAMADPIPYDGPLYEFDAATQSDFAKLTKRLEAQKRSPDVEP